MMRALILTALTLLPASGSVALSAQSGGVYEIEITEEAGDKLCTVLARQAPARTLVTELAARGGYTLEGLTELADPGTVTTHLQQRPIEHAIHVVLGCVGLRARIVGSTVRVQNETSIFPSADELEDLAEVAYLRAIRYWPDDERGAEAEMALAEIQEERGNLSAARSRYEILIEAHSDSALVPEALLRAGRILQGMGEWAEAAAKFTRLGNLGRPHPFEAVTRVELARCSAELGKARQALFMIDAADQLFPAGDDDDKRSRLLIRARAHNGLGDFDSALRCLDDLSLLGPDRETTMEVVRERARAMELSGRPSIASRAWLHFAESAEGNDREEALVEAARLSLAADDEMGTLFIVGRAHEVGSGEALRPWETEARRRLGLLPTDLADATPRQRVLRAQELLEQGLADSARRILKPVWTMRAALDADLRIECSVSYARSLARTTSMDAAVEPLRSLVPTLDDPEQRRRVYLVAGELYEEHGRFDDAVLAYGGTL